MQFLGLSVFEDWSGADAFHYARLHPGVLLRLAKCKEAKVKSHSLLQVVKSTLRYSSRPMFFRHPTSFQADQSRNALFYTMVALRLIFMYSISGRGWRLFPQARIQPGYTICLKSFQFSTCLESTAIFFMPAWGTVSSKLPV